MRSATAQHPLTDAQPLPGQRSQRGESGSHCPENPSGDSRPPHVCALSVTLGGGEYSVGQFGPVVLAVPPARPGSRVPAHLRAVRGTLKSSGFPGRGSECLGLGMRDLGISGSLAGNGLGDGSDCGGSPARFLGVCRHLRVAEGPCASPAPWGGRPGCRGDVLLPRVPTGAPAPRGDSDGRDRDAPGAVGQRRGAPGDAVGRGRAARRGWEGSLRGRAAARPWEAGGLPQRGAPHRGAGAGRLPADPGRAAQPGGAPGELPDRQLAGGDGLFVTDYFTRTPRKLSPFRSFASIELFHFHIPEDTVIAVWNLITFKEQGGTFGDQCPDRSITVIHLPRTVAGSTLGHLIHEWFCLNTHPGKVIVSSKSQLTDGFPRCL
ncbi:collagen alpha-2(I) chain-like [Tyto alba]|uniref:collagen alpha-2(I) chain-like n=1 Tax=Tyto alba TaxID=56313 RepID=UPI001C67868E|nr:collagen alpha-2(I) chain-like [Tyto alba]